MAYLLAGLLTLFGWWFSTGLILYLNHLPETAKRRSMFLASILLVYTLMHLPEVSRSTSQLAALTAFGQALVIWGWLEMGYLMGFVTGPSNSACPPDATGWTRFGLALKTSLYHELSVVALVLLVILLTAGNPNQVAALTCAALWLMRWSAKLNLFLGVSNFHAEWLPRTQQYLVSYMAQRRCNPLFPFSVTVGAGFAAVFIYRASVAADAHQITAYTIVGMILVLGVLEHLFLVLPVEDSRLWQWAMPRSRREAAVPKEGLLGNPGV